MQGPSHATSSCGSHDAPPHTACAQRSSTPALRPRQPACAAPTARACGCRKQHRQAIGHQHRAGHARLARPRARRPARLRHLRCVRRCRTTRAPCTWRRNTGVAPMASAKRSRLARTAAGASPLAPPRFMLSQGGALTPPARVVMHAPTPASAAHSGISQSAITGAAARPRLIRHRGIRTVASWRMPAAPCRPRTRASCAAGDRCGT